MKTKKCFTCKKELSLKKFKKDNRKYQLKADKGTCKVCISCEYKRSLEEMSAIYYDYETKDFKIIKFNNVQEINKYYKMKLNKVQEVLLVLISITVICVPLIAVAYIFGYLIDGDIMLIDMITCVFLSLIYLGLEMYKTRNINK